MFEPWQGVRHPASSKSTYLESTIMKAIKKVTFAGAVATLFANGDVIWNGMIFEQGMGMNAGLAKALA